MPSDLIRGARPDRRRCRNIGLVQFAILAIVAFAVAVDESSPSYEPRIWVPALLGLGVLLLWFWWWAMPRRFASFVIEITPDAISRVRRQARHERVVSRVEVVTAGLGGAARLSQLDFYGPTGERVGMIPLFQFDAQRVIAALRRHGWPVPEPGGFMCPVVPPEE